MGTPHTNWSMRTIGRNALHSNLEVASGDPMDYRSRTKAWHKFLDKMKRLVIHISLLHHIILLMKHFSTCGAAYNSYEFNIAWVAVGSAILNDQGLEESGETDGVNGVSTLTISASFLLMLWR